MSLYDVLDIIGDINSKVKFMLVGELANNAVTVNKIKDKLYKGSDPLDTMNEELKLNTLLSEMEYSDLEDRL